MRLHNFKHAASVSAQVAAGVQSPLILAQSLFAPLLVAEHLLSIHLDATERLKLLCVLCSLAAGSNEHMTVKILDEQYTCGKIKAKTAKPNSMGKYHVLISHVHTRPPHQNQHENAGNGALNTQNTRKFDKSLSLAMLISMKYFHLFELLGDSRADMRKKLRLRV